jgi:hypothetical protein
LLLSGSRLSAAALFLLAGALAPVVRAADYPASTTAEFQSALAAALPGDTITLQAGATFIGDFVLPPKSGSDWITIRSSMMANLPPAGVRVKPSDSAYMPKIRPVSSSSAISITDGAHHYRLVGLEILAAPGVYSYSLVSLAWGDETSIDRLAHDI